MAKWLTQPWFDETRAMVADLPLAPGLTRYSSRRDRRAPRRGHLPLALEVGRLASGAEHWDALTSRDHGVGRRRRGPRATSTPMWPSCRDE